MKPPNIGWSNNIHYVQRVWEKIKINNTIGDT